MNAMIDTDDSTPRSSFAPAHRTSVFKRLLQREFWEHKGGFFWAPVVTGGIMLALTVLGSITGSVLVGNHLQDAQRQITTNGLEIDGQTGLAAAQKAFGMAGDVSLLTGVGIACAVLAFTVFFYALGSLYDDRKDRSVLFWKSMPVSDTQVVLSKAAWALLLAPALAIGTGLLIGLALWLVSAATMQFNGIPGASAIFTHSHPLTVLLQVLSNLPIYLLWALPTVGWLMLCSAWARSKPFLWAILIPGLGATLISWLGTFPGLDIPLDKVWYTLVFRGLGSVAPGSWFLSEAFDASKAQQINSPDDLVAALNLDSSWQLFLSLDLWLGAIAGVAMLYAAIRLRRWRDEG